MNRMRMSQLTAAALLLVLGAGAAQADGDADNGKKVFHKCMACHRIGDGATNLVGPVLTGVVGRKAGTFADYAYSATMKAAGDQGLVWDDANITAYVQDPAGFIKKFLTDKGKPELIADKAKMTFKLPADASADDLVAYLATFSK